MTGRADTGIVGVHHIGVVVSDIAAAADIYIRRYGYETRTSIVHDPAQTAYVQFLKVPGDSVFLELVAPDRNQSKLTNSLRRGGGLNHICYLTTDIDLACRTLRADKMFILQWPVSAAAIPGRRIAWLMGQDQTPVELLESPPDGTEF